MLHVVCGAPCAGKTTYVENNAGENEVVIDTDKIAAAFGGKDHQSQGEPFEVALKARETAIQHALNSKNDVWLIDSLPTAENLKRYKTAGAEIVLLDVKKETCLSRAKDRPAGTVEAIEKYYGKTDALHTLHSLEGIKVENKTVEQGTEEKLFTQDEVNALIDKRFARTWEKYGDLDELKAKAEKFDELEEANKSELQKAQELASSLQAQVDALKTQGKLREMRDAIAKETGVPATLLTAETEDDCRAQAQAIIDFAKPAKYPKVRDAGEVTVTGKKENRDLFADWLNSKGD